LSLPAVFAYAFAGDRNIRTTPPPCPQCRSSQARRSRRRSISDYLLSFLRILPWRCESCGFRFYARPFPLRELLYAHCRICGNQELQRIAPHHVPGPAAFLGRVLGLPALRCEPCRYKFFTVRPIRQETTEETAADSE